MSAVGNVAREMGHAPPLRTVIAPSPLAASTAAGMAAAAWWLSDDPEASKWDFQSYEATRSIERQFIIPAVEAEFNHSIYYPERGGHDWFLVGSLGTVLNCGLLQAGSAHFNRVNAGVNGAYVLARRGRGPDPGRAKAHVVAPANSLKEAVECASIAIGKPGDALPWADIPIDQRYSTLAYLPKIPEGTPFESVVRLFERARRDVPVFRWTPWSRKPTFEPSDWNFWAEPDFLQPKLSRRLGYVSHKFLVGMAERGHKQREDNFHLHAMLDLAAKVRGLPISAGVIAAIEASYNANYYALHRRFCIVSDRPCELHFDGEGRSHNAHGPSHRWRDGFALYHWHGLPIPAHIIEKGAALTHDDVMAINETGLIGDEGIRDRALEVFLERQRSAV